MASPISTTLAEIDSLKRECLGLFNDLKGFHPPASGRPTYPSIYRLLVIPLLYSSWERCFTICNAVAWRRLREESLEANSLNSGEKSAWLMQASFYQSYIKKLLNAASLGSESKPKKQHFPTLRQFIGELDVWLASPLDANVDADDLVMTFSNVNEEVVEINAEALGISTFPAFQAIKLGRLHDLVGQRNTIGHGGILSPPPSDQFDDLWVFTETLIEDYCEAFKGWLVMRFPPPPPPPSRLARVLVAAGQMWSALTG